MSPSTDPLAHSPYRRNASPSLSDEPCPRRERGLARFAAFRLRELVGLALVVAGFDAWTFRAHFGGYGAAFFGGCLALAVAIAARARGGRRVWLRASPALALVLAASLRLAFDPGALTLLVLALAVLAFAVARRGGSILPTSLAKSALFALPALGSRIPALVRGVARVAVAPSWRRDRSALPALVPVALLVVFAAVFALANPLVASFLGRALAALTALCSTTALVRTVLLAAVALFASVLIRPALLRRRPRVVELPREGEASRTLLATARNSLVVLNLGFLAYNALDGVYLWAGSPPPGVTTQGYAHEGALWLTVALALVTVVLGVFFRGALAFDPRARLARLLSAVWIAQSGVVALGTFLRLWMHVRTSGMSDLRFVGALGTALVASGLVFVAVKIRRHLRFRWLAEGYLAAFAGAVALYALTPTHLLSAMYNVPRILAGEYGSLVHVRAEARERESVAALLPLLDHPDIRVRQGVASLLVREDEALTRALAEGAPSSSFATVHAAEALRGARPRIDGELARLTCSPRTLRGEGDARPDDPEHVLRDLVDLTVDGERPPSAHELPAATAWCHDPGD